MAQFDCTDENSHSLSSSSIFANLHSYFGENHPVNSLISKIQTMNTSELFSLDTSSVEDSGGLDESGDSLHEPEGSPHIDISSALSSAFTFLNFSAPSLEEDTPPLSDDQNTIQSTEGAASPAEEEDLSTSFQSKFIDFFPLYQDYSLQAVKDDLHRLSSSFVSEIINPEYLKGLQTRLIAQCGFGATTSQSNSPERTLSSPLPHPIRVTPCTLWQDLEEVKASGLLSSLTAREIRLQETIFELIGSEASYLRSLGVAVNHFYASKALKQTLNQMEHHILFSNIRRVMAASEKFLMDLEGRLGECVLIRQVGDIVLQHCPEFHRLYVPYVTNMMYQETLINQLLQQNRDFLYSIRKLESDAVCQRQSLKSFLVLPFQRITRVKLILESILKQTEPSSDSISVLKEAIEALHEIVADCDKGVQKMKQIEELVCLEVLLDFGKVKSVPLVISGRFLVQQGAMRQLTVSAYNSRVSFINIYLHLFNDLLIISKKDQRFRVMDYAEFPKHVHVEQLKTKLLGLPADSFLLHLSQSHNEKPTAMILVADTRSDKEKWMKALSNQ